MCYYVQWLIKLIFLIKEIMMEEGSSRNSVHHKVENTVPLSTVSS